MDFDDHSEESDLQPKVLKLPSETDIHELPNMNTLEGKDMDVSDIYVKVPIKTWLGYPSSHISFLSNPGIWDSNIWAQGRV